MEKGIDEIKTCPVCKKHFYVPNLSTWAFGKKVKKKPKIPYCSWSCFRNDKKEKRYCINCGKEFISTGSSFCDYYCKVDYENEERIVRKIASN